MKGLIVFSDGMEDNEALATLALLRRAGLIIDTASIKADLNVQTAYGITVKSDKNIMDLKLEDYSFLIIPGGRYVSEIIEDAAYIYNLIKYFNLNDKDIYAICAGPRFLGRLGLLDELDFTAFPGSEKDAIKGNYLEHKKVVVAPKVITARSAGAVIDFVYEIVKKNIDEAAAKSLIRNIMY